MSPGNYRLRIFAKNSNYDKLVVIRVISVPDTSYGCAVNLINDAVTVSDGGATIQFAGVGDVTEFACFLDGEVLNDECKFNSLISPWGFLPQVDMLLTFNACCMILEIPTL